MARRDNDGPDVPEIPAAFDRFRVTETTAAGEATQVRVRANDGRSYVGTRTDPPLIEDWRASDGAPSAITEGFFVDDTNLLLYIPSERFPSRSVMATCQRGFS